MGKQNINDKEHILVCLSSAPSNPKIIQTAAAMGKQRRFPARIYGDFAQKIEPSADSPQYIQTHVGIGYRMIKAE